MSYNFPPDLQSRLSARIDDGPYTSEDDVLREAMDALDRLEEDKVTRWRERNALAERQSRDGASKPLDEQAVLGRLRARLREEGIVG